MLYDLYARGGDVKKRLMIVTCALGAVATVAGNRLPGTDEVDAKVDAFVKSELERQ